MRSTRRLEIATPLLVSLLSISGGTFAQNGSRSPTATSAKASSARKQDGASAQLSAIAASGRLEDLRWPDFSDYRLHVTNFYRPSGYKLAWIRDGQPTPQALELIKIFQDADQEGLLAEDYDASRWPDRLTLLKGPHQAADEARFDSAVQIGVVVFHSQGGADAKFEQWLERYHPQRHPQYRQESRFAI